MFQKIKSGPKGDIQDGRQNTVFLLKCMKWHSTIYPNFSQREGLLEHWLKQIHLNCDVPMLKMAVKTHFFHKMHLKEILMH